MSDPADLAAEIALVRAEYGVMRKWVQQASEMAQTVLDTNRTLLADLDERNKRLEAVLVKLRDELED